MELPICPRHAKGHGCPKSDPVCISEADAGGDFYSFVCRTCKLAFAVSNPRGAAHARFERELHRQQAYARKGVR